MGKFALVKENEIVNVGYLPKKLFGIPEPQLNERGWYRVEKDNTNIEAWQSYSNSYEYNQEENKVIETKTVTDKDLDEWKDEKYAQLSKEGETYITNMYPLPIQLSAREGWYGEEKKTEILGWVKQHFDIIMLVKSDLYSCATHEEVSNVYFKKAVYENEGDLEPSGYVFWGE